MTKSDDKPPLSDNDSVFSNGVEFLILQKEKLLSLIVDPKDLAEGTRALNHIFDLPYAPDFNGREIIKFVTLFKSLVGSAAPSITYEFIASLLEDNIFVYLIEDPILRAEYLVKLGVLKEIPVRSKKTRKRSRTPLKPKA